MPASFRRLLDVVRRGPASQARAIDDEIAFHLQERIDALVDQGWRPADAATEAARRFGDLATERPALFAAAQQRDRRIGILERLDAIRTDLNVSVRQLRHAPTFACGTIAAFALGIGANATMFSVIDRLLLRPPPQVAEPRNVYTLRADPRRELSYPAFTLLRDNLSSAATIAVQTAPRQVAIGRADEATLAQSVFVDGGYFRTLGVRQVAGRLLSNDDAQLPSGQLVAVIGYGLWQRQFDGDPSVIGRELLVSTTAVRIIGVAPPGFNGVGSAPIDLWMPVTMATSLLPVGPQWPWATATNAAWLQSVARVAPGVSAERVAARATALLRAAAAEHATRDTSISIAVQSVLPSRASVFSPEAKIAALLGAVAVLVLLIACANATNLMLARAIRRQREIAVRLALGVTRRRLIASLVADALLLAALGGVVAVAVAAGGASVMRSVLLDGLVWNGPLVDARTLGFVAVTTIVAGLLTGLLPSVVLLRQLDVGAAIGEGRHTGGVHRHRLVSSLVVVQTVLSSVLLIGALLFSRSLMNVRRVPLGIDTEHTVVVTPDARMMRTVGGRADALFMELAAAVARAPGVASVALAEGVPFSQWYLSTRIGVPGRDAESPEIKRGAYIRAVTSSYFATIGTRIVRGRAFVDADDRADGERIAIVSADMARSLWPTGDAIGQCVRLGADTVPCRRIVGVAEATQESAVGPNEPASPYAAIVYVPLSQGRRTIDARTLIARMMTPGGDAVAKVRHAVQQAEPTMPLADVWFMQSKHDPELRPWRLGATMFTMFGALALVVSALGLYSVIAYGVTQRTREIGIRIALGAPGDRILGLIGGQGARLASYGVIIAIIAAAVLAPVVQPLLFQVSARSVTTYATVSLVVLVVAIAASLVPAARAARVNPMVALRAD